MKNIVKSHEEDDTHASSSITRLPDEIILQILNKLLDLKILCVCYLVSKRFSSIVLQVDAISFTAPFLNSNIPDNNAGDVDDGPFSKKLLMLLIKPLYLLRAMVFAPSKPLPPVMSSFYSESFRSAMTFQSKFSEVKSLRIELAFSSFGGIDNAILFKWKVKFAKVIESFIFLSPNSICDPDGFYRNGNRNGEEEIGLPNDLFKQKSKIAIQCLTDIIMWHKMMLYIVMRSPKLEEISITDSGGRGRLSLNGERLSEVKEWLHSPKVEDIPGSVSRCYIPVLNLPDSGYVMKGIFVIVMEMNDLHGGNVVMNSNDGFEDEEEAAYTEAVMEILEKHKDRMQKVI
ncbi:hypothetical protein L1887_32497 [Cichorium endivia]|nr:hypothetical protein L1887_32497 [Cichorium endivia]